MAGVFHTCSTPSVSTGPGATALTMIPYFAHSAPRLCVSTGLGGGVGRHAAHAGAPGHGSDVDDLAGLLPDHPAADCLREEEHTCEVGADHRIPLGPRQVLQERADAIAGVVDEQVDAAEGAERLRDDVIHLARLGHIALDGERAAPGRADVVRHPLQCGRAAAAHHHVGADAACRSCAAIE